MSNFVLLIMDAYNEKEKNDNNIKARTNLKEFIKDNKLICGMYTLIILSLTCFLVFSFVRTKHSNLYRLISILIYIVLFIILIPQFDKSFQKNFKKHIDTYDIKLNLLRDLLKNDFKLYELKKIEELIKQCDLIIDNFKISKEIFKPLVSFMKLWIVPILTFSLGLAVKKVDLNLMDIMILTFIAIATILMLLGIYYLIKNPVENYLDNVSNKVKSLKGMLIDIYVKDFI